jgi:AcrR family transcriptional regulator
MITPFSTLPLRARKRAQTRSALCAALVSRLSTRTLDDIGVAELCTEAGISQGTFFNYFPAKADLLTHFIRLWSLQVAVVARDAEARSASPLGAIEAIFASTAEGVSAAPGLMLETIAHQARMPVDLELPPIELAERALLLPDTHDVMSLPADGLGDVIPPLLGKAVAVGELPADADAEALMLAVASVFFGVPLVLGRRAPQAIGPMWQRQLRLVWAGARAGV